MAETETEDLSLAAAAELTGKSVSTLRRAIAAGVLPAKRSRILVSLSRQDVLRWADGSPIEQPQPEPTAAVA